MRTYSKFRCLTGFGVLLALLILPASMAFADSSTQSVTESYGTTGTLQQGMIVRLDDSNPMDVAALESDRSGEMHGVVVAANDAALTLSSDTSARQVYVATYGRYQVLVSDQGGVIKKGDYITVSSLNGIGMKASGKQSYVLGKALDGFDGTSNVQGTASLKNSSGKSVEVSLGRIDVDIAVSHNPLQAAAQAKGITGYLQNISNGVTGKNVSSVRIYLSLMVLIVSAFVAGSILYSGVRSSILSIGRNPLAKSSILRSLTQVVLSSVIIFLIGLFGVYLLLRL